MKTKIEITTFGGTILFTYESENNSIKNTLEEAVKSDANLSDANLSDANLSDANLSGAYLRGANLRGANLSGANLSDAYLHGANLSDANLSGANLSDAYLHGANLSDAKDADYAMAQTLIVSEGNVIAWKKCKDDKIVKLLIPEDAKRSNASSRKCRAEYVQVLEIYDLRDKRKKPEVAVSNYDNKTEYRVGETVKCDKWNPDRWEECSGGIHFFITELEAINYK